MSNQQCTCYTIKRKWWGLEDFPHSNWNSAEWPPIFWDAVYLEGKEESTFLVKLQKRWHSTAWEVALLRSSWKKRYCVGMVSVYPSTYSEASHLPCTDGELHLLSFPPSCNHSINLFSYGCNFNSMPTSYFVLKKVYKSWLNITRYIPLKLGENVKLGYTLSH